MSGIFGLVRLDGKPATNEEIAPIANALAHRGPDGGGTWVHGPVALGFALLATTPEAACETLPLTHALSGCTITADARLDSREELASKLGIDLRDRGDGELILLAYLRWGEVATEHLLGDFAFVIWDAPKRRLIAVRDPMGMRQLHYCHLEGHILAFATDDRGLIAHSEIPSTLSEIRVADFLANLEGADLTSTFYRGVERLPPAHMLTLERGTLRVRRYWTLEPTEPLRLRSTGEYAEAFFCVFKDAVRARLRSPSGVGAMLSGGLDSSSIVAIAASLRSGTPLRTFSAISDYHDGCPESEMIRRVQAIGGLETYEVRPSDLAEAAADLLPSMGRYNPFDGHMSLVASMYHKAQQSGCNAMLDGMAADVVLDHRNWIARLLRRGQFSKAWMEAQDEHRFWGPGVEPAALLLIEASRAAFLPDWSRALKRKTLLCSRQFFLKTEMVRSNFARRVGLAERMDRLAQLSPKTSQPYVSERVASILHNNLVAGRERYDRVASLFGIEARDPFLDLRLIKFSLGLPPEQLVHAGYTKRVLREAMAGLLPDGVRWRRGKEHLGRSFITSAISAQQPAWTNVIRTQLQTLSTWIRPDVLTQVDSGTALPESRHSWNVGYLSQWLDTKMVAIPPKVGD